MITRSRPMVSIEIDAMIAHAAPRAARLAALSMAKYSEAPRFPPPDYSTDQVLGDWFPGNPPLPANGERE